MECDTKKIELVWWFPSTNVPVRSVEFKRRDAYNADR